LFHVLAQNIFAVGGKENLIITPIVGFEKVQRIEPTPSMKSRTVLGVNAVYKLPISAIEAEYTHGQDDSTALATNTTYKYVDDKLKVGLRGGFDLASFLNWYIRGGMQAKQSKVTRTVGTQTSTSETHTSTDPYVGTGLRISFMQYFSLNADITAVYTPSDNAALKDYELMPSLGFAVRF